MANLVQDRNWRYVITLNSPDDGSRETRDRFREYLKVEHTHTQTWTQACIASTQAQTHAYTHTHTCTHTHTHTHTTHTHKHIHTQISHTHTHTKHTHTHTHTYTHMYSDANCTFAFFKLSVSHLSFLLVNDPDTVMARPRHNCFHCISTPAVTDILLVAPVGSEDIKRGKSAVLEGKAPFVLSNYTAH